MWGRLLVLGSIAGCAIEADLVECSDGRLCPAGTACDVAHASCVAPDQLTACAGAVDSSPCMSADIPDGYCFDQVCITAGCGNGFVEPSELCDDGNTASGDGCAAECNSREMCGDGFLDLVRAEQCDDKNLAGRDGCTAACTLEEQLWTKITTFQPSGRRDSDAVYDSFRELVVWFGGTQNSGVPIETYTWDGSLWMEHAATGPAGRSDMGFAFDPVRRRTVLFGGLTTLGFSNDTWEWTGEVWVRIRPLTSPSARVAAEMVWDGTRMLLFGGTDLDVEFDETWTFDGRTWTLVPTAHSPPPRAGAPMVRETNRVVLFGGANLSGPSLRDTWIFDGTDWSQLTTTGVPPELQDAGMAFDEARGVTVLVGEISSGAVVTWELAGATWTDRTPATPLYQNRGALVYDRGRQRVALIGGIDSNYNDVSTISEWTGSAWQVRTPTGLPPARQQCEMAFDTARRSAVMFGSDALDGVTWEWDGRRWSSSTPQPSPSGRLGMSLAFDPVTNEMLLFGGNDGTVRGDTWTYNGTRWFLRSTSGPSPRSFVALATDPDRDRVVLFGGDNGGAFGETWEWDGSGWTLRMPAMSPPARHSAEMAYDPLRKRVVLFGGEVGSIELDDTWEWDGTNWTEITPPTRPNKRSGFSLVYNWGRERITMFGGVFGSSSVWEWDGATWVPIAPLGAPFLLQKACGTYDDARDQIMSFGGGFLGPSPDMHVAKFAGDVEEVCVDGIDADGDGAVGCADSECARACP